MALLDVNDGGELRSFPMFREDLGQLFAFVGVFGLALEVKAHLYSQANRFESYRAETPQKPGDLGV